MARSIITRRCGGSWREGDTSSAPNPTPRFCCIFTPKRAWVWCTSFAGCLRSQFGTQERRALLLARDPYGIKPLYYANDGWTLRFASQVKALLAGGALPRDPDPAGQVGFCLFGSVPEPYTTYALIRSLPAGTVMLVDAVGPHAPKRYFSIAEVYHSAQADARRARGANAPQAVRDALLDSVRHHLVADVPVGAFLSAGIDSGALVGLMRDAGQQDIQTVTFSFEEFRGRAEDEAPLADQVARRYRHPASSIASSREREFRDDLPKILAAMDQPSIDGVNTWFVSKAAHELGLKVAVSGLGGDELFGGYPSFHQIPHLVQIMTVPSRVPLLAQDDPRCDREVRLGRRRFESQICGASRIRRQLSGRVSVAARALHAVGDHEIAARRIRHGGPAPSAPYGVHRELIAAGSRLELCQGGCARVRHSTCNTSSCETPTGQAWRTASRCACLLSTPCC